MALDTHIKDSGLTNFHFSKQSASRDSYALMILENIKKKYLCSFDDFDFAVETADNQLGNAGVSCDVTRSGYSWFSAVFGIRCWKIPLLDS